MNSIAQTTWFHISKNEFYNTPPESTGGCGRRAATGIGYQIDVLKFTEDTYTIRKFMVPADVRFYKDFFHGHSLEEAIMLVLSGNDYTALENSGNLILMGNESEPNQYHSNWDSKPNNYKLENFDRRGGNMVPELFILEDGVLYTWKSSHYEDRSWTEHFYPYDPSSYHFKPMEERRSSPYCEAFYIQSDAHFREVNELKAFA
jgi:hypothetical protein